MERKFIIINNEDSVGQYFKDVRKSELLTPAQEVEVAKRIQDGDEKAMDELVNANLKFVVSIAKDYQGNGLLLSDLISEGNYGLIKAAQKFDHTKGFRFISYAVWWVRQSIIQSLNENSRMVRLPANIINKLSYVKKQIAKFEAVNDREPVSGEIFDKDGKSMEVKRYPSCVSLNSEINEDGDELLNLIPAEVVDENELIIDDRIKTGISDALDTLTPREKEIIQCYFAIDTPFEGMTLEAIGEKYDLTKERIRQIKEKAIRKLRHNAHDLYELIND